MSVSVIEFRAWDGRNMVSDPYLQNHFKLAHLNENLIDCDNHYVLMPYVGIKDKSEHHKKIYLYDIVENPKIRGVRWLIEYRLDSEFVGFLPVEIGKKENCLSRSTSWKELVVVGNKFEMQELLGKAYERD